MSRTTFSTSFATFFVAACCVGVGAASEGLGEAPGNRNNHPTPGHRQHANQPRATIQAAAGAARLSHGGQLAKTESYHFEVVYRPKETRVYLFDAAHRPISARGVQGHVAMRVRGHARVFRYPLKFVGAKPGSYGRDCLAAAVDVSRIQNGDMRVSFALSNLPDSRQPRATFTQTFALSKIPVAVALPDASDAKRIARQEVCPVSGGRLGSMGRPIKVLVDGQPLYLCCQGCLGKVQDHPELFLRHVSPARGEFDDRATTGPVEIAWATADDQPAIRAQRKCPVTGTRLDRPSGGTRSMALRRPGTPIKITEGGRTLFVCCQECVAKVRRNPEPYFAKAAELRAARHPGGPAQQANGGCSHCG